MLAVPTHWMTSPDWVEAAQDMRKRVAEEISLLEQAPDMIDVTCMVAQTSLVNQCAVNPTGSRIETWEAVVHALQVGTALYQIIDRAEGVVECFIADEVRRLPAIGPIAKGTVHTWLTTFYLAVICADGARLELLSRVPIGRLRNPDVLVDEFLFSWVDTLQTWYRQEPEWAEKLMTTIRTSYPEVATIMPGDYLGRIAYQPINLFYTLLCHDDRFNEALVEALGHHHAYWTESPDREKDLEGCIALGVLAMTCMAKDMGVNLTVESEYIPRHLVEGSWRGEFVI